MEQLYKQWIEGLETNNPYYFQLWDNERKQREFMEFVKAHYKGRFFYAMPNYSMLTAKMRRKFKNLFKDIEPEYFDNLMIYRG